jgi:hypothetical protein
MADVVVDVEARLKALEVQVAAKESRFVAFVKANWAHFVTWVGVAYPLVKHLL